MPPLTFVKAKKIDSIRYPYGIKTISTSNNQRLLTTKATDNVAEQQRQRNNKGKEATKGYKRTPETTKAKNRRNATSNRGKGGKGKQPKKPPMRS